MAMKALLVQNAWRQEEYVNGSIMYTLPYKNIINTSSVVERGNFWLKFSACCFDNTSTFVRGASTDSENT